MAVEDRAQVLTHIATVTAGEEALTPRNLKTLNQLLDDQKLVMAFFDGSLAGWVVSEPLAFGLRELGMAYVETHFRAQPVFAALAKAVIEPQFAYVLATYNPALIRFVKSEYGFRSSSLIEVVLRSWGRFLFKRLGKAQRKSVAGRLRTQKPLFAIRGRLAVAK